MTFLAEIAGRYGSSYSQEFIESIERFAPHASRFLEWGSGETTRLLCDIALKRTDPLVMSIDDSDDYNPCCFRQSSSLSLSSFQAP